MLNSCQATILGKRKIRERTTDTLVIRLTSPSSTSEYHPDQSDADSEAPVASPSKVTASPYQYAALKSKKRYICSYEGCNKAYSKPSRLEEHTRSHTGQRPFVCETCGKSYLRDTHLNAHARTHLPNNSRPFVCAKNHCDKRFWTAQHLQAHHSWHDGAKPYKCQEPDCHEAFSKHHQLRAHVCKSHAPPGTKPFRCSHEGCTRSFDTNQHLRTHQKTHDSKRYTCSHSSCAPISSGSTIYFTTWSALQIHIRTSHPPTCQHVSCGGKTFLNPGNLRAHLKIHEQRDAEAILNEGDGSEADADNDTQHPSKKRRRGGELGRDWKCEVEGCEKDFKSKKALRTHTNVTHLGRRDFACDYTDCSHTFGYKHLLQRHIAKAHTAEKSSIGPTIPSSEIHSNSESDLPYPDDDLPDPTDDIFNIDMITGNTYARQANAKLGGAKTFQCPYPNLRGLLDLSSGQPSAAAASSTSRRCEYVYSRAYDLRRHLTASHNVISEKDIVDAWVRKEKRKSSSKCTQLTVARPCF